MTMEEFVKQWGLQGDRWDMPDKQEDPKDSNTWKSKYVKEILKMLTSQKINVETWVLKEKHYLVHAVCGKDDARVECAKMGVQEVT